MKKKHKPNEKKRGFFARLFGKKHNVQTNTFKANLDEENLEQEIEEKITAVAPSNKPTQSNLEEEKEAGIKRVEKLISQNSVFPKDLELKKYCDDLFVYLKDNGLSVQKNTLREMFGCMAASKLVIVYNENPVISERFIELVSEFMGAFYYKGTLPTSLETFDDFLSTDTKLRQAIVSADEAKNTVHITSVRDVTIETLDEHFNKIIDFSWNPLLPCSIETEQFKAVKEIPSNLWFMGLPTTKDISKLTLRVAQSAFAVQVNVKLVEPKEEVYENPIKLSYENFTNLLLGGYDEFYIKEDQWKKIDKVEAYLKQTANFAIDNRLFRQLERFTSTFLMFGGDRFDAMDTVLYTKLLPFISLFEINERLGGEDDILQIFEKQFGLENLTKSKGLIKNILEANKQKK